ncbi:MAG: hypothetical protein ACI9OJ_000497 [Myxococcota bacterium]|jgi:hypothetical protein
MNPGPVLAVAPVPALALVLVLSAVAPRSAHAVDLGYAFGAGVTIPLSDDLSELAGPGPHVDLGLQYKLLDYFSLGVGLSLDFPIPEERANGVTPDVYFVRISGRAMLHHGFEWFRYWLSLDVGLAFNTLSTCNERGFCESTAETQAGFDVSGGLAFVVHKELSIGPAVGITFPEFREADTLYFVHVSLRAHWNL